MEEFDGAIFGSFLATTYLGVLGKLKNKADAMELAIKFAMSMVQSGQGGGPQFPVTYVVNGDDYERMKRESQEGEKSDDEKEEPPKKEKK